jgi:hypothetical protein
MKVATHVTVAAGALDDEALTLPRPGAGDFDELKMNFFIRFTGFTRASSMSEGRFTPDFALGTTIFNDPTFLLVDTFVRLPEALP